MTLAGGVPQAYVLPWPNLTAGAYPNPNFPASLNGMTSVVDQNAGRPVRSNGAPDSSAKLSRTSWWMSPTSALEARGG